MKKYLNDLRYIEEILKNLNVKSSDYDSDSLFALAMANKLLAEVKLKRIIREIEFLENK